MSQYIKFITNNVLQKTKLNTRGSIVAERHHNLTCNHLPRTPYHSTPSLLQLLSSMWAMLSTLMVGIQQVWEKYDMQAIIKRIKL
jgi:hypothetical protein